MSILLFLVIIAIVEVILIATDWIGLSALVIIAALTILQKVFGVPITTYLPHSWQAWVGIVIGFFAVGAGWSVFRFYVECRRKSEELVLRKPGFGTVHHPGMDWNTFVDEQMPTASNMKQRIFIWIAAWPISILHFIAHDMLREVLTEIYNWMRGVYDSIGEHFKADIKD